MALLRIRRTEHLHAASRDMFYAKVAGMNVARWLRYVGEAPWPEPLPPAVTTMIDRCAVLEYGLLVELGSYGAGEPVRCQC